ncbi:MAG TPA: fasciclin domain-containing protein [Aggregatilineales bacterium]|nr:fasciclin domain-containing protein [Anaerolineae bacterium]HUN10545.1 fasciclin domain-containing protein [Aggregatilineales bacterium]
MKRRLVLALALLALLVGLVPMVSAGETPVARIRVAHFSPDTPAVEIFLNGAASGIQTLGFGAISGWVEVPAGRAVVAVAPAGAGIEAAAIGPAAFNLRAGSWTTIAAIGSLSAGTLTAATVGEDYRPLTAGNSRVTVFHGIEDAPAVDVITPDGTQVVSGLAFGRSATVTVPSGVYDLRVVPAGATSPVVINLAGTNLESATYYFVAATNKLAAPQVALSAVPLNVAAPLIRDEAPTHTIAQIAVATPNLSTLVTALQTAGLVDTFNGAGKFTVFAPTNAAFAALPAGTLEAVLADKALLTSILTYHVVAGEARASDVVAVSGLNTLNGRVTVEVRDGSVFLNGNVQIITTDILATNGVIHLIDAVLIP